MKRTLYTDGVEVDESDLDNTENTKIDEILLTRTELGRFGVIEGLSLTVLNNTITVNIGKASFPNGEIVEIDTPLTNVVGASFDAGIASFFGLRLAEVTSNPKPHEVDPVTYDTRAEGKVVGEFFIAAEPTADSKEIAKTNAINAQTIDGNYILLGELEGTGTGFVIRRNTQLPKTKGGLQPLVGEEAKSGEQLSRLVEIYSNDNNEEFPIHSAQDDFHRSLIGSGQPSPNNPHGMTIEDLGGDKNSLEHIEFEHTNGLIGRDPTSGTNNWFDSGTGSLAFSTADSPTNAVTVGPIVSPDTLLIRGNRFNSGSIPTTTISFVGKAAGLYYIAAKFGSDSTDVTVNAFLKDGPTGIDALCPTHQGVKEFPNNAFEFSAVSGLNEKKYFIVGLVFWNGSNAFRQMTEAGIIAVPTGGQLSFTPFDSSSPFFVPAGNKTIDLRRYGATSNFNVQRRSLRPDRITIPLLPQSTFVAHAGNNALSLTGTTGVRAAAAAGVQGPNLFGGDQTILKHLTDFDANNLFGHRGNRGATQHAAVFNDESSAAPPTDKPQNYGFQTNRDKWKQDNLTMTIFKWSDLNNVNGNKTIADGTTAGSGDIEKAGRYAVGRTGYMANFLARIGNVITSGGAASLNIDLIIGDSITPLFTFNNTDPDGLIKYAAGGPGLVVPGTFAAPTTIAIRRTASAPDRFRNLTVTAEYHYES